MADDIIPPEDMSNFDKIIQSIRTVRDTIGAGIQRGVDNASTGIRRAWDTLTVPGYGQDPDSAAADLQRQGKFQGSVFNQEYLKELKADPEFQKRQLDRATNIVLNTGAPGAMGLTTKTLERLPKKPVINTDTVRQQMARPDVSKAEKDILNLHLGDEPTINRADFEDKVGGDLLPLKVQKSDTYADYGLENIGVEFAGNPTPSELGAQTHIWKMPESEAHDFKHHFNGETGTMDGQQTYFAHTRRLDEGSTRNIVELQSDLFQKSKTIDQEKVAELSRMDNLMGTHSKMLDEFSKLPSSEIYGKQPKAAKAWMNKNQGDVIQFLNSVKSDTSIFTSGSLSSWRSFINKKPFEKWDFDSTHQLLNLLSKDIPVRRLELIKATSGGNLPRRAKSLEKTWYQRTIREENRLAAKEGVSTMRVPVGETAAKVEGWPVADFYHSPEIKGIEAEGTINAGSREETAKYTGNISNEGTDYVKLEMVTPSGKKLWTNVFDLEDHRLEGLVNKTLDNEDPVRSGFFPEHQGIHDFYDKDVRKFVAKEYGAKEVTDKNGHKWMEWKVDPKAKDRPVQALTAGAPGTDVSDDKDKIDLTPIDKHIEFLRKLRNGGSARSR